MWSIMGNAHHHHQRGQLRRGVERWCCLHSEDEESGSSPSVSFSAIPAVASHPTVVLRTGSAQSVVWGGGPRFFYSHHRSPCAVFPGWTLSCPTLSSASTHQLNHLGCSGVSDWHLPSWQFYSLRVQNPPPHLQIQVCSVQSSSRVKSKRVTTGLLHSPAPLCPSLCSLPVQSLGHTPARSYNRKPTTTF